MGIMTIVLSLNMKGSVRMYCGNLEKRLKKFSDAMNFQQSKEDAHKKGLMKGIAFGTLLGAVLGVLYAPDKGEVTRQKTKDEAMRLKEQMDEHFEQGKERASELLEEKKGRAEEIWLSTKTNFTSDSKDSEEETFSDEEEQTKE